MCFIYSIDDNPVENFISKTLFARNLNVTRHQLFTKASAALQLLSDNKESYDELPDFIFLDLNMPEMDGWSFLNSFHKLSPLIKKISIVILSSSIDEADHLRSKSFPSVIKFIAKPLTKETLHMLLNTD